MKSLNGQRRRRLSRRSLLKGVGGGLIAAPFYDLLAGRTAAAHDGNAHRVIFFYFPDGVAGPSQAGDPSMWHAWGSELDFQLGHLLEPMAAYRDRSVFLNGLSMGATDSGSHPGGAKKLLTAADHAGGESIDQLLARTVGSSMPWRHLYLGAMANQNNASGDKHISYPTGGQSIPPEDDPRMAFELLFGTPLADSQERDVDPQRRLSVIDAVLSDMKSLKGRLGTVEGAKLDLHLEALREVEQRLGGGPVDDPTDPKDRPQPVGATCEDPWIDTGSFGDADLYDPARFGDVLRAQIDLMVLAMACGKTKVGTIQCSQHTSELIMSRIPGSEMHDPSYDMRSHQASHYGSSHDPSSREFSDFVAQRRWFVEQYAYLLARLEATPEGDGTMLDHTLCVLCTEVCDGNTHLHDNMPFVVSGGAGGRLTGGRLHDGEEARAAGLVEGPGGGGLGEPGLDADLPRGVWSAAGLATVAPDDLVHVGGIDPGALHRRLRCGNAQLRGGQGRQAATELADGGAARAADVDRVHHSSPRGTSRWSPVARSLMRTVPFFWSSGPTM